MNREPPKNGCAKARGDFNDFMNRAVRGGALAVEHVRVRVRQPATEVFARKALAAVRQLAPGTCLGILVSEHKSSGAAGPAAWGEGVALLMETRPALARYLGQPGAGQLAAEPHGLSPTELFGLLHAYAQYEAAWRTGAAPVFSSGALSVSAGLGGGPLGVPKAVAAAADSVFAQSLADVHALSLMAAFDGRDAAFKALGQVLAAREAGGDFGAFSLAPLSQDTRSALELLRAQLKSGKDFAALSREELMENSRWAAAEGMGAWLQRHGVDYQDAVRARMALEAVGDLVAQASQPAAAARPALRPVA